jgi:hypothetical protein
MIPLYSLTSAKTGGKKQEARSKKQVVEEQECVLKS